MAAAHQLLMSLEWPSVTNARANGDGGLDLQALIYPSVLASMVGLGWSKDNLRTADKCFVNATFENGSIAFPCDAVRQRSVQITDRADSPGEPEPRAGWHLRSAECSAGGARGKDYIEPHAGHGYLRKQRLAAAAVISADTHRAGAPACRRLAAKRQWPPRWQAAPSAARLGHLHCRVDRRETLRRGRALCRGWLLAAAWQARSGAGCSLQATGDSRGEAPGEHGGCRLAAFSRGYLGHTERFLRRGRGFVPECYDGEQQPNAIPTMH